MQPGAFRTQTPHAVLCSWCKHYTTAASASGECTNCGGPLPPPPGTFAGTPPPAAPRHIPEQYRKEQLFSKNVVAIVGLVFAIVGSLIGVVGLALLCVVPVVGVGLVLFGGIFAAVGFPMRSHARRNALRKLDALGNGEIAQGTIVSVGPDMTESINRQHPTRIDYVFMAHGRPTSGAANGWDAVHRMRTPGEPLWVVYLPADPSASSIWPPIA